MSNAHAMAQRLSARLTELHTGSLRFWGVWFGRPYDNIHRIVSCEAQADMLKLTFNEQETLSVWSPEGLDAQSGAFRIARAAKVRWEWFSYGRPKIEANRYFMEFTNSNGIIAAATDFIPLATALDGNVTEAAVEIL